MWVQVQLNAAWIEGACMYANPMAGHPHINASWLAEWQQEWEQGWETGTVHQYTA
jgi:hypothetical protein